MRDISYQRCPICNAKYPPDVLFCPSCGAELLKTTDYESYYSGREMQGAFITQIVNRDMGALINNEGKENLPLAWRLNGIETPLKKKGKINYYDKVQLGTFKLKEFVKSKLITFVLSLLSIIKALLITGIVGAAVAYTSNNLNLLGFISLLILFCEINESLGFIISKVSLRTVQKIKSSKNNQDNNNKTTRSATKTFLYNLLLGQIKYILIILFSFLISANIQSSIAASYNQYYFLFVSIGLIVTLISPTFEYIRDLAIIRGELRAQEIIDILQFPEVGIKKIMKYIGITYFMPIAAITLLTRPVVHGMVAVSTNSETFVLDIVALIFVIVVLSSVTLVGAAYRTHSVYNFEELLKRYSIPPQISWIEEKPKEELNLFPKEVNDSISSLLAPERKRCDFCSAEIMDGLQYCPKCGHKV